MGTAGQCTLDRLHLIRNENCKPAAVKNVMKIRFSQQERNLTNRVTISFQGTTVLCGVTDLLNQIE